ncbi:ABC transporter substrate-binding protein [Streptomyces sp. 3MP-14]|uniref:ABC transporter substrate-binding protein n=1 Tax=Streptomyces mimosae TaxID=2586635 RepID=A0A5N6A801_9ACTN|nr:ABC transporter substrate-binding protein [Streptomyces mimosae]KAB8176737.1 ABC transporter substrate-binding protein [Streptomyces sp. 3MP-14]
MRSTRVVPLCLALGLALTACGGGGDDDAAEPTGSQTAAPSADSEAPPNLPDGWHYVAGDDIPAETATPELPVTVVDGTDTEVTVDDASRVIVGGDDVAAILGGLGLADLVYAAPENSASTVALEAPQQFAFSQETGTEGLLSVDGTLFIGNNPARHGDVAAQFRDAGVDAVVLDDQQSTADKIRDIAGYLGVDEAGERLAGTVEEQLAEASETAEGIGGADELRVLQVTSSGAGGANAVVGTGTAGADIVQALGATSVGVEAGLRGYSVEFSDEGLLDARPDVILMGTADLEEWGDLEGFVQAFPTLLDTPAGQAGNIVVMPSEQIKVSGPASGAGAKALALALAELAA